MYDVRVCCLRVRAEHGAGVHGDVGAGGLSVLRGEHVALARGAQHALRYTFFVETAYKLIFCNILQLS